jgi:hypothetical protein
VGGVCLKSALAEQGKIGVKQTGFDAEQGEAVDQSRVRRGMQQSSFGLDQQSIANAEQIDGAGAELTKLD